MYDILLVNIVRTQVTKRVNKAVLKKKYELNPDCGIQKAGVIKNDRIPNEHHFVIMIGCEQYVVRKDVYRRFLIKQ